MKFPGASSHKQSSRLLLQLFFKIFQSFCHTSTVVRVAQGLSYFNKQSTTQSTHTRREKKKKLRKHFPGLSLYESCFFGLFHTRLSKPLVFSPSGRCSSTRFRLEIWVFTNFDRKRKWSRKAPDNERITNKKCSSPPYHEGGALYHELVDKKIFFGTEKGDAVL